MKTPNTPEQAAAIMMSRMTDDQLDEFFDFISANRVEDAGPNDITGKLYAAAYDELMIREEIARAKAP